MIAISHTLNKLATDSEIIVMNAAGFSPFRLFRPFYMPPSWWRSWLPLLPPISPPTACAA
jgi:Lipopolysaccharide export system permease LptF/LptG